MNTDGKKRKLDTATSSLTEEKREDCFFSAYGLTDFCYTEKNFSQTAIRSLEETLFGEATTEEKSTMFICATLTPSHSEQEATVHSWLKLDIEEGEDGSQTSCSISTVDDKMKNSDNGFPQDLLHLKEYGCSTWKSKIIIAGGTCTLDLDAAEYYLSDKVYTYDTDAERWDQFAPMICRRGSCPLLVVAGDRIFTFGGEPRCVGIGATYTDEREELDNNHRAVWAEYCDVTSDAPCWSLFPKFPKTSLFKRSLSEYAVYPKGSLVLFWLNSEVIAFNYSTWDWITYDAQDSITKGPHWSASVVVIDHFLFWHDYRTIYAHDLSLANGVTLPVYKFGDSTVYDHVYDFDNFDSTRPTFLVRVGKHLCLFWWEKKDSIQFFAFQVEIGRGAGASTLSLQPGRSGLLEAAASYVGLALVVSSSVKEEKN